ncbi:hypothetical protein [Dendronalium phyllosphericum]|nr:hypothetical protein [Dendronalium phyllosphericum]
MPFWSVWKNGDAESAIALLGYLGGDCDRALARKLFSLKKWA